MLSDSNLDGDNYDKQKDEIEALSSIYGVDFHTENSENNSFSIEINETQQARLEVILPLGYPTFSPPSYSLSAPWLKGPKRQELCGYLDEIYLENIGESIIYLWVERIRQFINEENDTNEAILESVSNEISEIDLNDSPSSCTSSPVIHSGEIITDRKSHFQSHVAEVRSMSEIKQVLKTLYENKKIANATHNMYAYRFKQGSSSVMYQDCDDDGETHAGGRMLHLLQILNVENVVVIVSRWYGGIQLGPARFKHINNATRQILVAQGYVKEPANKEKKSKKKSP